MAYIYKITNLKNNKCYIGQTQADVFRRFQRHLQDAKNGSTTHFHRALRKYPITCWSFQIIEEVKPEKLDGRERYYIQFYDSMNNGYNISSGGQNGPNLDIHRKLNDREIEEIQKRLKNTNDDFISIGSDYGVSFSCISDINTGRTWKNNNYSYPIRKRNERSMSYQCFLLIIEMLQTHIFSMQKIGGIVNIGNNTIGKINNGIYTKFNYPTQIKNFPIHDYKKIKIASQSKVTLENVVQILLDFIKSDGIRDYSKWKDCMCQTNYNNIVRGETPQYIQLFLKHPLLEYSKENIQILNNLIKIYYKYNA